MRAHEIDCSHLYCAHPEATELSDDPLLHFRWEACWESRRRRLSETKPTILPE